MKPVQLVAGLLTAAFTGGALHAQAHVHGQGEAELTLAADRVSVRLTIPAGDLFGFERAPESEEERAAVDAVAERMEESPLISFAGRAGCTLDEADFTAPGLSEDGGHHHEHRHEHAHEHESGHDHDADQAHDHFASDTSAAPSSHADAVVEWEFACAAPEQLGHADLTALFEAFPAITRMEAAALIEGEPFYGALAPRRARLDLD